jgi:hypothetical protein
MDCTKNDAANSSSVVVFVFIATVNVFAKPLPSNKRRIHIDTQAHERGL